MLRPMKAAVYYETGGPDVFRYEDVPDPECHPQGVTIRVEAVSIEGGDVLNRAGGMLASRPHCVGYQAAGTIVEVGAEVTERSIGQRVASVFPFGSHAELRQVGWRQSFVVPDALGIEEAATVPIPFGTADDCLFEYGRLKKGETVLVQAGSSGVGLAAIQLAKRAGARVITTASSPAKLERLREIGADHGIDYTRQDFVAEVKALTDGRGVDVLVDGVGGEVTQRGFEVVAYKGRVLMYGTVARDFARYDLSEMRMNKSITGVSLTPEFATDRVVSMVERHLRDVAKGELRVVIDRRFPLAEAAAAHAYIESRQAFGRVLLVP
jgi:NADPH2:quinone reductase